MKTTNYTINDNLLDNNIDFELYKNEKNILVQVFSGKNEKDFKNTINFLLEKLPNAICIGSSTDGEINEHKVQTNSIVVSISTFENTLVKSSYIKKGTSFEKGEKLAKDLITANTKLLILFTDGLQMNADVFLKGVSSISKDVVICGGMAADNANFSNTYISCGKEILEYGAVGVSLNSDVLLVKNDYRFNWSSIGVEHKITKVENNRIYEINGIKTIDFYKKYLGENILDNLIENAISFPLLVKRDKILIARGLVKIFDDGSFQYTGNFKLTDTVQFGFGNTETILKDPIIKSLDAYKNTQSFFIYSCMARRRYIPDLIQKENSAFANITNTAGFFTHGEFYTNKKKAELLNQAFTIVALTEDYNHDNKTELVSKKPKNESSNYSKTMQILTHLMDQSSKDYDIQSKNLESEKFTSEILVASQKIFLRHAVHETNTPISVIMSNIELYEMEHGKNYYLSNIEVALKNIFNIYDDLSYLVKKDQVSYPCKNIDVIDYIRSRIDFFRLPALQIGSKFIFHTQEKSLNYNFNETKLQRIIDNNLTNAIKYTAENSNIYITMIREYNQFTIDISSCSQYIQYPKKIFKEYYREESTQQGFGLGLSLVKRICDEENIRIAIDSNEYYTSFKYIFPMEEQ